jgi:hypothetical protein
MMKVALKLRIMLAVLVTLTLSVFVLAYKPKPITDATIHSAREAWRTNTFTNVVVPEVGPL